jgi:hypothetical protein
LAREQTDLERFPYDTLTPVARRTWTGGGPKRRGRSRLRPKSRPPLKDKNLAKESPMADKRKLELNLLGGTKIRAEHIAKMYERLTGRPYTGG